MCLEEVLAAAVLPSETRTIFSILLLGIIAALGGPEGLVVS